MSASCLFPLPVRSAAPRRESSSGGFTLIELFVVVAIIGIIAAIAVPVLLKRVERGAGEATAGVEKADLVQKPIEASVVGKIGGEAAIPPTLEWSRVEVLLDVSQAVEGFQATTVYDASFEGTFRLRNQDRQADSIRLRFPFPSGVTEVRDATFEARGRAAEKFAEPLQGVWYSTRGIEWEAPLGPGEGVEVRVAYRAAGKEAFRYAVAGGGRTGRLEFTLRLPGVTQAHVPSSALQPTGRDALPDRGIRLTWAFENLITDRIIACELPATDSPMGRLILLARLAGLAILLYGAGFWYLAEGYGPGSLREFYWPHFLLLAGTYFIFFPVHAYLGLRWAGEPWGPGAALVLATSSSIPLLTLHVARFIDRRFALTRNLPLALVTLAAVVGTVLLRDHRLTISLAIGVLLLAFLTLTYPAWSARREKHLAIRDEEHDREQREAMLARALEEIARRHATIDEQAEAMAPNRPKEVWEAPLRVASALALFDEVREKALEERSQADVRFQNLGSLKEYEAFSHEAHRLSDFLQRHESRLADLENAAAEVLAAGKEEARLVVQRAEAERRRREEEREAGRRAEEAARRTEVHHCAECGAELMAQHRHCPACGARRPLSLACTACQAILTIPANVLTPGWEDRLPRYCLRCGGPVAVG